MTVEYDAFLRQKVDLAKTCGFAVCDDEIHPSLKPGGRK